jgi:hypothetical protein
MKWEMSFSKTPIFRSSPRRSSIANPRRSGSHLAIRSDGADVDDAVPTGGNGRSNFEDWIVSFGR